MTYGHAKRERLMKCKRCAALQVTWTESKRSYVRMVKHGMPPEKAKGLSPFCGKCTTQEIGPAVSQSGVGR